MFSEIRHDVDTNVITLISDTGLIEIPYGMYLMVRDIRSDNYFVGRIVRCSDTVLGFDVLAAESGSSEYKFSIELFLREIAVCREFKLTDIPRIINWSWIGIELNYRYFKKG